MRFEFRDWRQFENTIGKVEIKEGDQIVIRGSTYTCHWTVTEVRDSRLHKPPPRAEVAVPSNPLDP